MSDGGESEDYNARELAAVLRLCDDLAVWRLRVSKKKGGWVLPCSTAKIIATKKKPMC
jgi:hypothetical protein